MCVLPMKLIKYTNKAILLIVVIYHRVYIDSNATCVTSGP